MTKLDKQLISERDSLQIELDNSSFTDPAKVRRIDKINSLLLTDGNDDIKLTGKIRRSERVTSFTPDRR